MSRQLEHDALLWEEGSLTAAELERRHPTDDVGGLLEVFRHMSALTDEPVPDPETGWAQVLLRLPDPSPIAERRLRRGVRRGLVAGLAAAMLGGTSIAYAAGVPQVRHGVERVVHTVTDLLGVGGVDRDKKWILPSPPSVQGSGDDGSQSQTGREDQPGRGEQGHQAGAADEGNSNETGTSGDTEGGSGPQGHSHGGQGTGVEGESPENSSGGQGDSANDGGSGTEGESAANDGPATDANPGTDGGSGQQGSSESNQ